MGGHQAAPTQNGCRDIKRFTGDPVNGERGEVGINSGFTVFQPPPWLPKVL
jgi:hypothetical protein